MDSDISVRQLRYFGFGGTLYLSLALIGYCKMIMIIKVRTSEADMFILSKLFAFLVFNNNWTIKKINSRNRYLIFGYIGSIQSTLWQNTALIYDLDSAYNRYYFDDLDLKWDKSKYGDAIKIIDNTTIQNFLTN